MGRGGAGWGGVWGGVGWWVVVGGGGWWGGGVVGWWGVGCGCGGVDIVREGEPTVCQVLQCSSDLPQETDIILEINGVKGDDNAMAAGQMNSGETGKVSLQWMAF